jgi:transcriptional regulator with PAS, ATPase and Fis domain
MVLKPFEPEDLKIKVKRAVETFELKRELDEYRSRLELRVEESTKELKDTQAHLLQTEKELIALIFNYDFPGNIREQGWDIDLSETGTSEIIFADSLPTFEEMKKIYTDEVMKRANNNHTKASEIAGLDKSTFIRYWKGREKKNIGESNIINQELA